MAEILVTGMLPPPGDPAVPSPARIYDCLAGGVDHWPADRELAARMEDLYPGVRDLIHANRIYLAFAVMQARNRGISQFIDLGSGFPGAGSVLEIAQAHDEDSRVASIDWDAEIADPVVGYGPLLDDRGVKNSAVVLADIREPAKVLADPAVAALIDLSQPVALILGLVAHYWRPGVAEDVIAGYLDETVSGSLVAVTVNRSCGDPGFASMRAAWASATAGAWVDYTQADLEGLFAGLKVLGTVGPVTKPRLAGPCTAAHVAGGIAIKP